MKKIIEAIATIVIVSVLVSCLQGVNSFFRGYKFDTEKGIYQNHSTHLKVKIPKEYTMEMPNDGTTELVISGDADKNMATIVYIPEYICQVMSLTSEKDVVSMLVDEIPFSEPEKDGTRKLGGKKYTYLRFLENYNGQASELVEGLEGTIDMAVDYRFFVRKDGSKYVVVTIVGLGTTEKEAQKSAKKMEKVFK